MRNLPFLKTDNELVNSAFRIAIGDISGNIQPYSGELFDKEKAVFNAGLDYNRPWTRDAAINVWNGAGLISHELAENTLRSVLKNDSEYGLIIGGEYWDAIIWASGAWHHYLSTGDKVFLKEALDAVENSLAFFENTEFSEKDGLFRGGACFQDGIAAYPDDMVCGGCGSGIINWLDWNKNKKIKNGVGIPIFALSTNCLYYNAYLLADKMSTELNCELCGKNSDKAAKLAENIIGTFYSDDGFAYLKTPSGLCTHQEGFGNAFALLFNICDEKMTENIFRTQYITKAGIPCVWPTFSRYRSFGSDDYGRHSGTVWPQVQGFWAESAAKNGKTAKFADEFFNLAEFANRDGHFAEIYHPETCQVYGGIQEKGEEGIVKWDSCRRQTWSATAFIRMVINGLYGMTLSEHGIEINPIKIPQISHSVLENLKIRDFRIKVLFDFTSGRKKQLKINGKEQKSAFIPWNHTEKNIRIEIS